MKVDSPEQFFAQSVHGVDDHGFYISLLATVLGKFGDAAAHNLCFVVHSKLINDLHKRVLVACARLLPMRMETLSSAGHQQIKRHMQYTACAESAVMDRCSQQHIWDTDGVIILMGNMADGSSGTLLSRSGAQ